VTKPGTLPTFPTIAALAVAGVALAVAAAFAMVPRVPAHTTVLSVADLGRRVLVIAPHPDDETLVTGAVIHHLLASGATVRLVIVSAGDSYSGAARLLTTGPLDAAAYRLLGDTRHAEGLRAIARLGLDASDVTFLGYPDTHIAAMWDAGWDMPAAVTGAPGTDVVPYDWAARPGVSNCGSELASDLSGILADFRPDTVITPDTRETHNDHATISAFATLAMDEAGFTGTRLTDVVHYKLFPRPKAFLPGTGIAPPPALTADGEMWRCVWVDPADELAKRSALWEYPSELDVADLGVYMRAFIRRNELFCEWPAASAASAPGDARPAAGVGGTVMVTPKPAVAPLHDYKAWIDSLRMVRGPKTLWVGVVTAEPVSSAIDYRVSLRLVGGGRPTERIDVLVRGGSATAQRVSSQSLVPGDVSASAAGSTMWVSVPASTLEGRTRVLLGASAGVSGEPPFRTAWRDVAL
jgi:N-acetyl-1-D-myo-inositol-2-amino-2-deoxy-alpha-D-glucopyranoside deacetylase